jgi:hypothetical protein
MNPGQAQVGTLLLLLDHGAVPFPLQTWWVFPFFIWSTGPAIYLLSLGGGYWEQVLPCLFCLPFPPLHGFGAC